MVLAMRKRAHSNAITVTTRKRAMSWLKLDCPGHEPETRVMGSPRKGDAPVSSVR